MERLQAELELRLDRLAAHGLLRVSTSGSYVSFESPKVHLDIGYDVVDGALALAASIRRRGDRRTHCLASAQRRLGVPECPARATVIETDADLGPAVERLFAGLTAIEPLLAGDDRAFARLEEPALAAA